MLHDITLNQLEHTCHSAFLVFWMHTWILGMSSKVDKGQRLWNQKVLELVEVKRNIWNATLGKRWEGINI